MKLPSTVFIAHCPTLSPERKVFLSKHLEERVPIKDVRWCEDFNNDHPFVEWLYQYIKPPCGLNNTSLSVKNFEMFKTMIDENIDNAFILTDDVAFHKDWLQYYESIEELPLFINMGVGLCLDIKPEIGKMPIIYNNGGCECIYVTNTFAKLMLNCININHSIDMVYHGVLYSINYPIYSLPICYQTSIIECQSLCSTPEGPPDPRRVDWVTFIKTYKMSAVTYPFLLEKYQEYLNMKEQKEKQIYEIYGKHTNLKNIDYIMNINGFSNKMIE